MWLTNYIVQDCKPSIPILNNQLYTHLPVLFHVLTLFSRNSIMWNSLYLKITRNSLYLKIFSWSSFKLLTIHLPKSRQNKAKSSPPLYDHIVYFVDFIDTMKELHYVKLVVSQNHKKLFVSQNILLFFFQATYDSSPKK